MAFTNDMLRDMQQWGSAKTIYKPTTLWQLMKSTIDEYCIGWNVIRNVTSQAAHSWHYSTSRADDSLLSKYSYNDCHKVKNRICAMKLVDSMPATYVC